MFYTDTEKKGGRITSYSQETRVEVMGKNLKVSSSPCPGFASSAPIAEHVHVGLPGDDVIWSVFSYDNNGEGQLFTEGCFFHFEPTWSVVERDTT